MKYRFLRFWHCRLSNLLETINGFDWNNKKNTTMLGQGVRSKMGKGHSRPSRLGTRGSMALRDPFLQPRGPLHKHS